jgi:predicted metal-binding protein
MVNRKSLIAIALESRASHAAVLDTAQIQFHEDFRKACEKNLCGKFDTTWMGPPAIGPISALMQRASQYAHGLLFQTVQPVTGSFDMRAMIEAAKTHETVFRNLLARIKKEYPGEDLLPLNAGCCSICPKCAYLDGELCRNPDQAVSSVEAYGINVIALQKSAGLPHFGGKNTVTYVGLILFDKRRIH